MTDDEFYDWFLPRAEKFAAIGIMHPRSEWGRLLKLSIIANSEHFERLQNQITALQLEVQQLKAEKLSVDLPTTKIENADIKTTKPKKSKPRSKKTDQ